MVETRAERDQREAEAYLDDAFRFLVDEFGYTSIGRIPVTSDEVTVRGYVNQHAGRQVELSGHPPGVTFMGGIRKLRNGAPAPYDRDHFITFEDIAHVRLGELDDRLSHNLNPNGWRGVVDTAVALLKGEPRLLTGDDWVSHSSIAAEWARHFRSNFGFVPSGNGEDWPLGEFKSRFAFLASQGYLITYDTTTLTPHEYAVGRALHYAAGSSTVKIRCIDFRDNDWVVTCDDRPIGGVFKPSTETIAAVASHVAAELR
jgi:hypothetical protein